MKIPSPAYLCGPMTGLPQMNFPAFDEAAAILRGHGIGVINPAEIDRELGFNPSNTDVSSTPEFLAEAAQRDLTEIIQNAESLIVLPNWEDSKGVAAEIATANWIGIPIYYVMEFETCFAIIDAESGENVWIWIEGTVGMNTMASQEPDCHDVEAEDRWMEGWLSGVNLMASQEPDYPDAEDETSHSILPTDAEERKNTPIFSACMQYFPLALAAVARISKLGADQHCDGVLHWDRSKSSDELDSLVRHLIDGDYDAVAWRALAHLQKEEEKRLNKPPSPACKKP